MPSELTIKVKADDSLICDIGQVTVAYVTEIGALRIFRNHDGELLRCDPVVRMDIWEFISECRKIKAMFP